MDSARPSQGPFGWNPPPIVDCIIAAMPQLKEPYYSRASLQQKANAFCRRLERFRPRRPFRFSPAHSALLVLDVQAYFLEPASHAYVPSGPAIVPGIVRLVQAYRRLGLPIVFTQHLNAPQDAGMMAVWWRDLITLENPFHPLVPEVEANAGLLIRKGQYDAFYRTPLEERLRSWGASQVVICGLVANLCCETTARSAFVRGFEVFFAVDGTAAYNEEFHLATLLNLSHGFAIPVLVEELLAALRGENG